MELMLEYVLKRRLKKAEREFAAEKEKGKKRAREKEEDPNPVPDERAFQAIGKRILEEEVLFPSKRCTA